MHGVVGEQAGTLLKVTRWPGSYHDSPQAHDLAGAGALHQQPCHQAADTTKAIEHHVLGFGQGLFIHTIQISQLVGDEFIHIQCIITLRFLVIHETNREFAEIDLGVP